MKTTVSAVFKISDGFLKKPVSASAVVFYLDGERKKPLYKDGGYFVFTDLPPGKALFKICSPFYCERLIQAELPPADGPYMMFYLILSPSPRYPFCREATTISGVLQVMGKPMPDAKAYLFTEPDPKSAVKTAQDDIKPGLDRIKLFASVTGAEITVPSVWYIQDKKAENREICMITSKNTDGTCQLEKGLRFSHTRGTALAETIELQTGYDGSFFIMLPPDQCKNRQIYLLLPDSQILPLELTAGRNNDIGMIESGRKTLRKGGG